jgi:hypothetical protein
MKAHLLTVTSEVQFFPTNLHGTSRLMDGELTSSVFSNLVPPDKPPTDDPFNPSFLTGWVKLRTPRLYAPTDKPVVVYRPN